MRASEKKRVAVMGLLREMQRRDVPVDALGVQSHIDGAEEGRERAGVWRGVAEDDCRGARDGAEGSGDGDGCE